MSLWLTCSDRLKRINAEVQKYDNRLYAQLSDSRIPCLFRKNSIGRADLVFPLTHNWLITGEVVDWGVCAIWDKLQRSDNAGRAVLQEMEEHNERVEKSQEREKANKRESWAREFAPILAKETKDLNLALIKSDLKFEKQKEKKLWR